ncbi:MAG: valine--tRNA ligase, partial [Acidobacteriota bacterium]
FVAKVWEWKEDHGNQIKEQLERLGASCDWTRARFTLDEGLSRAVRHVFVTLYNEGLIYRDLAMVNWCPRCGTAISDIEVEYKDTEGKLYLIDYPVVGDERRLTVATTRPETMLGDTAVAVHPDDVRYQSLVGKQVALPLTSRTIPIITDAILVDPEFGTGVVKITPAHDKNDYEAGMRNELPRIQVIDEAGMMTDAAGALFAGLDRDAARIAVVEALQSQGLLREVKAHQHSVAYCGKCDAVVEPMISRQWFVRVEALAQPALEVVRSGRVEVLPESWLSTYYNWMENIHDWCISRQLWWGHRIPAWYCDCGEMIVSEEPPASCPSCSQDTLRQETDVLDTWFSSALWPFSTMGWPEKTADLQAFYPTDTLITGFDILFFWVARMIMMGIRFTGVPPFRRVFLNGLVRDEHGQKMSKSRGNVIDPLVIVDEYGADALRFTLAILTSGRDIPLARSRIEGYAAFATKIWNATRFALMHIEQDLQSAKPILRDELNAVERWILSRLNTATAEVNRALSNFRFDEAANRIYQFFWHEFCDWYIEMSKPVLSGRHGDRAAQEKAKRVLLEVLDRSLRLLHPFMPFITEELWQKLGAREPSIMIANYPLAEEILEDAGAEAVIQTIQQIITLVRTLRLERGFAPKDRFRLNLTIPDQRDAQFFQSNAYLLLELARLSVVTINESVRDDAYRDSIDGLEIAIEFPEKVLTEEQVERVARDIEKLEQDLAATEVQLENEKFVGRAPAAVVQQVRDKRQDLMARLEKLRQNAGGNAS